MNSIMIGEDEKDIHDLLNTTSDGQAGFSVSFRQRRRGEDGEIPCRPFGPSIRPSAEGLGLRLRGLSSPLALLMNVRFS
jgi:hypothetical protein